MPLATPAVRIHNLRFRYRGTSHDALSMPRLEIDRPGLVAITGPSGVGKSTLLELLAGTLNQPYSGSLQVLGKEWSELKADRSRQFHLRRIGLIPQDLGLLPSQTPRQMLKRALMDAGMAERECDRAIMRALTQMDIDAYADRRIAEMSGGQKQRVAIARALVRNVDLILADEPTANLNTQLSDETVGVLRRIAQTIPVIIVTHDPRVAALCGRQVHLEAPTTPAALPAVAAIPATVRTEAAVLAFRPPLRKVGVIGGAVAAVLLAGGLAMAGPLSSSGSHHPVQRAEVTAATTPASPSPAAASPAAQPAAAPAAAAPAPSAAPAAPKTKTVTQVTTKPRTPATAAATQPATQAPAVAAQPAAALPSPVATTIPVATPTTPATSAAPVPGSLAWWLQLSQQFSGTGTKATP